jgi:hypothetical protein
LFVGREKSVAALEAAMDDVAAVLGHRRTVAGLDQLADLRDDLRVSGVVLDLLGGDVDARGGARIEQGGAAGGTRDAGF